MLPDLPKIITNSKIEFLDLKISISEVLLKTNLFVKPSNQQLFLDFNSNHPSHCKQAIPYSQALRVVERCAAPMDRDKHLENLKEKLEKRNHPKNLSMQIFQKPEKKQGGTFYAKKETRTKTNSRMTKLD